MKSSHPFIYLIFAALFASSPAHAIDPSVKSGNGAGNGGGAHHCPTPKPGQLEFEAYDLYAARNPVNKKYKYRVYSWDGVTDKATYLKQAIEKITRVNRPLAEAIQRGLDLLSAKVEDKGDKELDLVPDARNLFHDKGCGYYQLVNWLDGDAIRSHGLDEETVLRDEAVYTTKLDPLSQAANDLHEAAGKVRRANGLSDDTGTIWIQRFVAQVFSADAIDFDTISKVGVYPVEAGFYRQGHLDQEIQSVDEGDSVALYLDRPCASEEINAGTIRVINTGDRKYIASDFGFQFIGTARGVFSRRLKSGRAYTAKFTKAFFSPPGKPAADLAPITFGYVMPSKVFGGTRDAAPLRIEIEVCGVTKTLSYLGRPWSNSDETHHGPGYIHLTLGLHPVRY